MELFGNLIGKGEMGYIFDVAYNSNLVVKLVQIRPYVDGEVKPFRETFEQLRSPRAKKIAVNELQANLFRKLHKKPLSNHLPEIYDFDYGGPTWYVSTDDSDDGNGAIYSPFSSIQYAIDTSSEIIYGIIGTKVNTSSVTAIVEDISKKNIEKIYDKH